MKKGLFCGVLASFFFAFTFILNRSMNLAGGYWMWSGVLRYIFALPMLAIAVRFGGKGRLAAVWHAIGQDAGRWILWSIVGFGVFYLPVTLASTFGESWLTAASWQLTIVAGVLLTPLFGKKIPVKNLLMSFVILIGVALLQWKNIRTAQLTGLYALIPITIGAFAYPLGNRKMMTVCPPELDTIQRVFGMTLCSMPFWIAAGIVSLCVSGLPSGGQVLQSLGVALFSSTVATLLFFHATDLVKANPRQLAVIEATQCGEVLFTLLGGILVLHDALPDAAGFAGIALVVIGMVCSSLLAGSDGKS